MSLVSSNIDKNTDRGLSMHVRTSEKLQWQFQGYKKAHIIQQTTFNTFYCLLIITCLFSVQVIDYLEHTHAL